jgi:flagellar motility protein MotE (MotC chaperone)
MMRQTLRRKGALHVIGTLLILSGLLRAGIAGQAWAESAVPDAPVAEEAAIDAEGVPSDNPALLAAIQARETRITDRERQIEDRMIALRVAEEEAAERVAALTAAEESLASTIALADVAAETDIQKLVAVYENMKPKEAAALFSQMTPDFAAGFLALMQPPIAAQIMAQVSPETAYSISVVLAGRNADVPTE